MHLLKTSLPQSIAQAKRLAVGAASGSGGAGLGLAICVSHPASLRAAEEARPARGGRFHRGPVHTLIFVFPQQKGADSRFVDLTQAAS